ncbi:unnamed protein product [Absidia cylindrospora]
MKFNILALSATVFLFNQVFAAPADTNSVEKVPHLETDNALEADLMTHHGWDKKDTEVLTTFLDSIDSLSEMVGQAATEYPAVAGVLTEFQTNAKQMMAEAGYEYRQLSDNRRVLTRVSSENGVFHEELIPELIDNLVKKLTGLLTTLQKKLSDLGLPDIITKMIGSVAGLIQKIGDKISKFLAGLGL